MSIPRYFIFLNQKMNIYKRKFVSRLGLMHMLASNLCIWIKVGEGWWIPRPPGYSI